MQNFIFIHCKKMTTTTHDMMQECIDGWIKDITYGIMAIKNIHSCKNADYLSKEQRDSIKNSVDKLKATLEALPDLNIVVKNPLMDYSDDWIATLTSNSTGE